MLNAAEYRGGDNTRAKRWMPRRQSGCFHECSVVKPRIKRDVMLRQRVHELGLSESKILPYIWDIAIPARAFQLCCLKQINHAYLAYVTHTYRYYTTPNVYFYDVQVTYCSG